MEQAWSCRIICEIKRHRRARWGCFLWVESLFYGNWNRQVCLKWKCEVDRSSRSTGVGLDKKQKCCSLSCVFSQAQQNASHYGNFQTFVCLQTKRRHQCTEKLEIYFFHIFMKVLFIFCNLVILRTCTFTKYALRSTISLFYGKHCTWKMKQPYMYVM